MKFDQLHALYHQPLFDLISQSRAVHLVQLPLQNHVLAASEVFVNDGILILNSYHLPYLGTIRIHVKPSNCSRT